MAPIQTMLCFLLVASGAQGSRLGGEGFVRALEFNHRLRVCNAYPYAAELDVFRGKERLTGEESMPYKACRDFVSQLKAGDKLEFRVGDASAGTFAISDLPNNDAVLMLVIHRHDTMSTAVSFESHVFASLANAQVAIIDAYKGSEQATPRIADLPDKKKKAPTRSEELRYNSVVAVDAGQYEVLLEDANGTVKSTAGLVAVPHESYVVLRTGVEAQQGESFPEELVVYPQSIVRSGAAVARLSFAFVASLVMALVR